MLAYEAYYAVVMASDWPSDDPATGFATVPVKTCWHHTSPEDGLQLCPCQRAPASSPCKANAALSTEFCKHELPLGSNWCVLCPST